MAMLNKTAPWIETYNKMREFFRYDDDIDIIYDNEELEIKLYVDDATKAEALQLFLPCEKKFGNVILKITVIPGNRGLRMTRSIGIEDVFKGNGIVDDIVKVDNAGFSATYVVFKKEVVQYFDDNLSDINGLCSTLYQDIANDIFENHTGIFFCTNNKKSEIYVSSNPFVTTKYTATVN